MEGLHTELIDNFLSADFGLPTNLFEDEFLLENILTEDVIADDLAVRGIKEELESWAGVSSASSSPTFIHRNGSSGSSDSEEEKYRTTTVNPYEFLRDVVVNGERNNRSEVSMNEPRDTPSPGSTSSSSGCFSDFSCKTNDTNVNVLSHGRAFDQIPPATLTLPNPPQNTCPLQFIQSPPVAPTADPIPIQQQSQKLKKTVILSPQDFDQLMKNMRGSRAMPRIQTFAQPVPVTIKQNPLVAARPAAEPMACPSNQVVDERRYKKQQRLIRNRESANLSRKKKKEFVDTLQETIQRLGTEKEQLVNENTQLRAQLVNNVCSRCSQSVLEVSLKGSGQPRAIKGYVTKKNSMLLLAMILTVSLNFGPLNNMLTTKTGAQHFGLSSAQSTTQDHVQLRRHILWAEEQPQGIDSSALRNSTVTPKTRSQDRIEQPVFNPNITRDTMSNCSTSTPPTHQDQGSHYQPYINQTENVRIASELHRWIGEPEYLNATGEGRPTKISQILTSLEVQKNFQYDGNYLVNLIPKKYLKNRKLTTRKNKRAEGLPVERSAEVDVFKPARRGEMKYAELFRELRRKEDTFYVVSFNADHLMLPALAYNHTKRPKMSLMFPAVGFNGSIDEAHVMMMQIDCEVLDTALIQVKEKLIPEHLRRFQNETQVPANDRMEPLAARKDAVVRHQFGPELPKWSDLNYRNKTQN